MKLSRDAFSFDALEQRLAQLSARERRIVQLGALLAPVLLIVGVLLPLDHSVSQTHARLLKSAPTWSGCRACRASSPSRPVRPPAAGSRCS